MCDPHESQPTRPRRLASLNQRKTEGVPHPHLHLYIEEMRLVEDTELMGVLLNQYIRKTSYRVDGRTSSCNKILFIDGQIISGLRYIALFPSNGRIYIN